ncbi:MAG: NADH-quinone oxidoreductase subunit N [bacterium]|nr:NADH-quinone oxidoreductase subunit N [bacterium]
MEFQLPEINLQLMAPEIFLFLWALAVMAFDVTTKRKSSSTAGNLALVGLAVTGVIMVFTDQGRGFGNMFFNDSMAVFFKVIFLAAAFMAIGSSFGLTHTRILNHRGEYFGLILLSTVGMMFLASSSELISLYIGLELTTIPLFVLAAFFKDDRKSVEAGIKYLVVGAFSSALLLYGLSFIYGLTGTTDIAQIRSILAHSAVAGFNPAYQESTPIMVMAVLAILGGIGFKLALPPFHQWVPDVYEGAPTPITAFLSVGSKAAGLVAFAKIMIMGLYDLYDPSKAPNDWGILVGVMAAAAMIVGNVLAIRQTNIKRMLAYSSIAHAGYVMVGMLALNSLGLASVGYYMFAYLFTNMGAFAIVALIEDRTGSCEIASYAGLSKTSPFLAISMTIFLLSLTGIPPLAGFFGKFYVFAAAIKMAETGSGLTWIYWLVGVGLVTSVFALYYYANVMRTMYFVETDSPLKVTMSPMAVAVIVIGVVGVVVFGLNPQPIVQFASDMPAALGALLP